MKAWADLRELRFPCESAHRFTVSLAGVQPLTITLPYPILANSIKATLRRKDGVVEVVADKALNNLWPEDVVREQQFRWNVENLEPWANSALLSDHCLSQFSIFHGMAASHFLFQTESLMWNVRSAISRIFQVVNEQKRIYFHVTETEDPKKNPALWYIRAHPPVRMSPEGTPILIISVWDRRLSQQLQDDGEISSRRIAQDFQRVIDQKLQPEGFNAVYIKAEVANLFRYILRLNSTKMEPTPWQKENLPLDQPSPWLATFLSPLYMDQSLKEELRLMYCATCRKDSSKDPKRCGRCKSVTYCSVECQRANWPKHKPTCCKVE